MPSQVAAAKMCATLILRDGRGVHPRPGRVQVSDSTVINRQHSYESFRITIKNVRTICLVFVTYNNAQHVRYNFQLYRLSGVVDDVQNALDNVNQRYNK